jgi:hypothetical protein
MQTLIVRSCDWVDLFQVLLEIVIEVDSSRNDLVDGVRQVMSCDIHERQLRRVGLECSKSETRE